MADTKITALTAITTVDPAADVLPIVDVSDTSMAASGTTKKITSNQILGAGGTATLASATITGALTVGNGISATQTFSGVTNILDIGYGSLRGGSAYGDVRLWTDRFRIYNNAGTQIIKNISGTNGDETWYDGAGGTRMTLNSTGLGVGGSPSYKLSSIGTTNNQVVLHVGNTAGTVDGDTTNVVRFAAGSGANALWANARYDGFSHAWRCNSTTTEAMVLNSSGNVGIGVTPSAWGSTYRALQIGLGTSLTGVTNDVDVNLVNNARFDGTNWKYTNSSPAERYRAASGTHYWYNAASGTAGNNITWTQAMTLDASGNLLVGTTDTSSTSGAGFKIIGSGLGPYVVNAASTNAALAYTMYSTGAAAYRFYVGWGGTVFATNTTISAISDARLKENVQDIDVGLGAILALKPRKFDWKAGKGKDIKGDRGFIAQEFEQVFPQLVDEWKGAAPEGEAPYKSVRQDLIPVLVKAIQELTARVQTLETR